MQGGVQGVSDDVASPLAELPGTWTGDGLTVVRRPARGTDLLTEPEVRRTHEAIAFAAVGPPDGESAPDASAASTNRVQYVHETSDAQSGQALGVQTGMWLTLTRQPDVDTEAGIARLATLRDGQTLLATGTVATIDGPPEIPSARPAAVDLATGVPLADRAGTWSAEERESGLIVDEADDPNAVLRSRIRAQRVMLTTLLTVEAAAGLDRDLRELPFAVRNPDSLSLRETLWIERIAQTARREMVVLQLQYSQRILLGRDGIGWPSVSLGTLRRK